MPVPIDTGLGRYVLDEHGEPVPEPDLFKWAAWYESTFSAKTDSPRRVAQTNVSKWNVSTVFLALDHRFGPGPPLLYETMVFAKNPTRPIYSPLRKKKPTRNYASRMG